MAEYISRDAVFQVVHGIARGIADKDTEAFKAKDMKAFYMAKGAKEILDSVDTDLCYIPTSDVQPVKRGRWIGGEVIQCSNCNFTLNGTSYGRIVNKYFSYCPKCGARMDGGAENETY